MRLNYTKPQVDARIMLGQDWGYTDEEEACETPETLHKIRAGNDRNGPSFFPVIADKTAWATDVIP